jgi:hypothetical protein
MNREILKTELTLLGVEPHAYSLDGGLPSERHVISEESDGKWGVYYSERGQKTGLKIFDSESDACVFFLERITEDLGIKRK